MVNITFVSEVQKNRPIPFPWLLILNRIKCKGVSVAAQSRAFL